MRYLPMALGLLLFACAARADHDPRQVLNAHSPPGLLAVGKLTVPGIKSRNGYRLNHREDCSATLVSPAGAIEAQIIVSAWHCLEFYRDLSKEIIFTINGLNGERLSTPALTLADGGSMYADWAVLKLQTPLPLHQAQALALSSQTLTTGSELIMAGFSRDQGLGAGGKHLTYDPHCLVTEQSSSRGITSDCRAHKGASGGAVIQIADGGKAVLAGVISQGNGDDVSTFVPIDDFRGAVLRAFNH